MYGDGKYIKQLRFSTKYELIKGISHVSYLMYIPDDLWSLCRHMCALRSWIEFFDWMKEIYRLDIWYTEYFVRVQMYLMYIYEGTVSSDSSFALKASFTNEKIVYMKHENPREVIAYKKKFAHICGIWFIC